MIIIDHSRTRVLGGDVPGMIAQISFSEICVVCGEDVPNERLVLRHTETKNIICQTCLNEIAEIK